MVPEPEELPWTDVPTVLVELADGDLDAGLPPSPRLAAFAGEHPLGIARLRPFGPGEVLNPLIELLALFLPIGADRVALALPGRVWSLDDPVVPVCDDGDLRATALVLACVDGTATPAQPSCVLHPYDAAQPAGSRWAAAWDPGEIPEAPALTALTILLSERDELTADGDRTAMLERQLGRVLLLGHELALAPTAVERLGTAAVALG